MRLASVLAASLFAAIALAEEQPAPPPVPPSTRLPPINTPTWSLGAGLSFTPPLNALGITGSQFSPILSVERVFSPRFALGLGVDGSVQLESVLSATIFTGLLGLGVSPRFTLTKPDAPVAFTLFTTLFASYGRAPGTAGFATTFGTSVGLAGGLAFELRLVERLSVRAQASVVSAGISSTTSSPVFGSVSLRQDVLTARLVFAPSVELRLYL